MKPGNDTQFSGFLLLGLSKEPELQPVIFGLFLSMYLITVLGNLLIILAVSSDSNLHILMCFFLSNLSFVDICFTSTTIPKMLWNIQTQSKGNTYEGYITQMYFSILFGQISTGFDGLCPLLHHLSPPALQYHPESPALGTADAGVLDLECPKFLVIKLNDVVIVLCTDMEIPHFFCDLNQMFKLECILALLLYSSPSSAIASVTYTVVTSMLNPFIYSLRNEDINGSSEEIIWDGRYKRTNHSGGEEVSLIA
ncbi:olfactory receptor 7A17-like [Bos indicus]|uniref:Olfactory receptor 7A17-like n=1 Tax=Bos indicus TaxID=9915 RepID=A0ABM4SKL1_BOSIN